MILEGKNAIVTGGLKGIGKAIATEFCRNGANVLIVFRGDEERTVKVREGLSGLPGQVEFLSGDVADSATADAAAAKCKELWGSVDILVNNAGVTNDKLLPRMGDEDFDQVIDTNLKGSFYFLRAAAKIMSKQRSGSIINMSSVAGIYGNPAQTNYSASKAGVIGLTKSAAKELGRRGIRVNAIAPGFIETDMTAALTEDQKAAAAENITLGRMGQGSDIANGALFLASDMSSYITGQVLGIDGGIRL